MAEPMDIDWQQSPPHFPQTTFGTKRKFESFKESLQRPIHRTHSTRSKAGEGFFNINNDPNWGENPFGGLPLTRAQRAKFANLARRVSNSPQQRRETKQVIARTQDSLSTGSRSWNPFNWARDYLVNPIRNHWVIPAVYSAGISIVWGSCQIIGAGTQPQIIAVSANARGTKRRAVDIGFVSPETKSIIPGSYPGLSVPSSPSQQGASIDSSPIHTTYSAGPEIGSTDPMSEPENPSDARPIQPNRKVTTAKAQRTGTIAGALQDQLKTPPDTRPSSALSLLNGKEATGTKQDSPMDNQLDSPPNDQFDSPPDALSRSGPILRRQNTSNTLKSPPHLWQKDAVPKRVGTPSRVWDRIEPAERLPVPPGRGIRRLPPPRTVLNKAPRKQEPLTGDKYADELIERLNKSLSRAALTAEEIRAEEAEPPVLKYRELIGLDDPKIRLQREKNEEHDYYTEKDERALADWKLRRELKRKEVLRTIKESQLRAEKEAEEAAQQIQREAQEAAAKVKAQKAAERKATREAEVARRVEAARVEEEQRRAEEASRHPSWLKKQKLVRPLDPEWSKKVEEVLEIKNPEKVVAQAVDGTDIRRHDIETVVSAKNRTPWLNDEIVNSILAAIVSRKLEKTGYVKGAQNVPAYAAMASQWYVNVRSKGMRSIENWSKRKGIKGEKLLDCEKVFFPTNSGSHWTLTIISPQAKTIEVLDSLDKGQQKHEVPFATARQWLEMELGKAYVAEDWTDLLSSRSAQQTNSDDCGVFTCFNALAAAKGRDYREVGLGSMDDARHTLAAVLLNGGFKNDFEL